MTAELQLLTIAKHFPGIFPVNQSFQEQVQDHKCTVSAAKRKEVCKGKPDSHSEIYQACDILHWILQPKVF